MIPPATTTGEPERLAALRRLGILDTPPEPAFDDLTRLAAQICGAPIALISLVGADRQWCQSSHGLAAAGAPPDVAFCSHAILTPDVPMLVEDARLDPRFADNPLVTGEPHIRAYAGVPLVGVDGHALGTLCVIDRVPRRLTADQLDALQRLARQVLSQIDLRQAAARLRLELHDVAAAHGELARSEQHYRELVENAQGVILYHELDGTIRMINGAGCRALGRARADMLGANLREFVPPEYWEGYERYLQLAEQNGHFQGLLTLQGPGGRRIALAYQNFVFESPDGPLVMAHGIDISDRVRIEGVNRRMARVLDSSPDFVAFFDRDGLPTYMNRAARTMCGLAVNTPVLGTPLEALLGSDGQAREFREALERARDNGGTSQCETHIQHRDGTLTPVSRLVLAQVGYQGSVEFYALIARDISERLRDEQSILASEQRFRRVVESLQDVLFETDQDGRWTYLNPAWTEITGFDPDDSLGRNIIDFVHEDDRDLHEKRFLPLLRRDKALSRYEVRCRTRGSAVRWIEVHARMTDDGRGTGTSGTLRDITEQRELSDALVRAGQEALAASRLKSEFVANMSHEVRTPINGVIGLTTLLLDTPLSGEQRDLSEGIRSSAEALLTIVNDVLDLSKIEAGKLTIDPVSFELRKELTSALEPVTVKAQKKGLALVMNVASDVPSSIISDPTRIRQVLINLADNAIKFTHQGMVSIAVSALTPAGERPRLRFAVADQGIGIAAEKLDAIFEKFTQADSSTTRKYGGSGLGLTICRQLVELMGGEIGVFSTVGEGSTFWFELPLVEAARARVAVESAGAAAPLVAGLHVLVAEDNTINQKVARRFLEKLGCSVEIVENGEEALARVGTHRYDAVFMDCQMPKMDGYEATRRIRLLPDCRQLPIIAMTAHAMRGDREKCLDAGMSDYLSKPLQSEALATALARIGSTAAQEGAA